MSKAVTKRYRYDCKCGTDPMFGTLKIAPALESRMFDMIDRAWAEAHNRPGCGLKSKVIEPLSKLARTHLIVEAGVRYWEDATVNGQEDIDGSLIPLRRGDAWCPMIELATGQLVDWPQGTTADIHYKVCDNGAYWLGDAAGNKAAKWKGDYVPDEFLCVGDNGFGDYIIMKVDSAGRIIGWKPPVINKAQWAATEPADGR